MKPDYISPDGSVTLYRADCRDVLPTLTGADSVLSDPPFGIGFSEYASHNDDTHGYPQLIGQVVNASESLIKNGWCVFFQGAKRAYEWSMLIPRKWRVMACAKNFTQILPGIGPLWSTDFALFWPVGEPKQRGIGRDYHLANTSDMSTRPKGHPCPRPIDQMRYVVECFSDKGDLIIDPFLGSGTTAVACIKTGRRCIGIEIDKGYFDIAVRRIERAFEDQALFVPPPVETQAEMFTEEP